MEMVRVRCYPVRNRVSLMRSTVVLVTVAAVFVYVFLYYNHPSIARIRQRQLLHLWNRVSGQDVFQAVDRNFSTTYVYSAYLDDRPAPDVNKTVVRVFAWFHRYRHSPLDSNRRWRCIFWNDDFEVVGSVEVSGFTDTNSYDSRSKIARAMLLCPIGIYKCTTYGNVSVRQGDTACARPPSPRAVSVVSSEYHSHHPINLIRLVDLPGKRNAELSHSNRSMGKQLSFAVCVRPLYSNFNKSIAVRDVVEFIEVMKVFGAELFVFYVDDSVGKKVRRCLEHYEQLHLVETVVWSLPRDLYHQVPENGQYLAMTECQYRLMYRTKYLVIVDVDEFIVPARTEDWPSMLALINANLDWQHPNGDRIASYSVRNRFFPMEKPDFDPPTPEGTSNSSSSMMNWTRDFKTLAKVTGLVELHPWKVRSKIIAAPDRVLVWHTHEICGHHVVPPGEFNVYVNEADAVMHHYRNDVVDKRANTTYAKFRRMWSFNHKTLPHLRKAVDLVKLIESL